MEIMNGYANVENREEIIDGIPVHRAWIYVSNSKSIVARLLNYFSFVWSSYIRGRKLENFDYLMVESPPLFLGYSAMALAKKLHSKLIFKVSDLWPESAEKLGIVTNKHLLKLAYNLEGKCYTKSHLITGQTQGIVDDIKNRLPQKNVYLLPNGVDTTFYNLEQISASTFREKHNFKDNDLLFFYGGILEHAQGLEVILKAASLLSEKKNIQFIIQGTGPEKDKLLEMSATLKLKNVHFLNPVPKSEMPSVLKSIDVALVPLKKLDLFQGAIPSKVFEAFAMKKPLLLGVDGEARKHLIEKGQARMFFEPENVKELAYCALFLSKNPEELHRKSENARYYVSENFDRNKITIDFLRELNSIDQNNP